MEDVRCKMDDGIYTPALRALHLSLSALCGKKELTKHPTLCALCFPSCSLWLKDGKCKMDDGIYTQLCALCTFLSAPFAVKKD
jgi:hypothetical protein